MKTVLSYRAASVVPASVNREARTVELSFSSETPVDRHFGREVLSHDPAAVRLDRLNRGGPFLVGHDSERQVGIVEKAYIGKDRKGRALVRFSRTPRGDDIFLDIVDGIRPNISVGYTVHKMVRTESTDDVPTFTVTDWEPIEISTVSVAADLEVGIARNK
ncbi:MAG: HK97 family phage prohead protease [Spirochaetes bacterium]|nr:HK97 family phage prohead protease [Spirochaetota bacterium]